MHPLILKSIISIVLGSIVGIAVIKLLFKTSIFASISIFWLIDLLFVIMNTRIGDEFPDQYPYAVVFGLNVLASTILVFFSYQFISKRLIKSISRLKALANGDLSQDQNIFKEVLNRKDEIGELARINIAITDAFKKVIGDINNSAKLINNIGTEMSETSGHLTNAASAQAASIEEISASMEQMMANIESNTEVAVDTEVVANSAHQAVQDGNSSALEALNSIKDISEKIKLVTDIAFQTNILALNAAVEASRAGEHGKGFAVVAAEVRKLAERSKVTADEIVQMSVAGTNISEKAIDLLNKTLPLINSTTNQVQNISAASKEQRSGAAQINASVQSINESTQYNVNTAEHMAASSQELISQADKLLENIKYFKM